MEYTFPFSSSAEETTEQGTTATEPASSNGESADNVIVIAENIFLFFNCDSHYLQLTNTSIYTVYKELQNLQLL